MENENKRVILLEKDDEQSITSIHKIGDFKYIQEYTNQLFKGIFLAQNSLEMQKYLEFLSLPTEITYDFFLLDISDSEEPNEYYNNLSTSELNNLIEESKRQNKLIFEKEF